MPAGTFCTMETPSAAPAGSGAFTVTTTHYELYAETAQDRAIEMGRLLEASYGAFTAWFEAEPKLGAGERLHVKLFADEASWAAGLMADGLAVPPEAGGYFSPTTRSAYLFVQGNPYYTHVLLVHEATHQFHELARTKGQALPFWYTEGHAEYLSRHDWDGRCVKLGTVPLLSWEDLPAKALDEAKGGIDLAGITAGTTTASRAASWAIFGFLDQGANKPKFKAFRDAFDANQIDGAHSFATLVGDPAALAAPLAAWIPGAQERMRPIFTEWIHVGPEAVIAESPVYFSLAIVKGAATHFEASYDVPGGSSWSAGVVVGFDDSDNYAAIVVSADQKLRSFIATAGSAVWKDLGSGPASLGDGTGALAADYEGNGVVSVTVNGQKTMTSIGSMTPRAGLAINDGRVAFHGVSWK